MELQNALQTKDAQMLKLAQTMIPMLNREESLQTQNADLGVQGPPQLEPMSYFGFATEIFESQLLGLQIGAMALKFSP